LNANLDFKYLREKLRAILVGLLKISQVDQSQTNGSDSITVTGFNWMAEDPARKVILVGDAGVGKTSVMFSYADGVFSQQLATVGSAQRTVQVDVGGKTVPLDIWDTAGQERYRAQIRLYLTRATAALIVFDVTDEASIDHVSEWVDILMQGIDPECKLFLVGNKIDLDPNPEAFQVRGDSLANRIHAEGFYMTSAVTRDGLEALFTAVALGVAEAPLEQEPQLELVTKAEPKRKKRLC
jgi:small GTP-binding protein